jgi:hypothetical protein
LKPTTQRETEHRGTALGYGFLAVACLCVAAALLWPTSEQEAMLATEGLAPTGAGTPAATGSAPSAAQRASEADPWLSHPWLTAGTSGAAASDDLADHVSDAEKKGNGPSMAEVIDRLHKAGVYTGLGAFQPPGTSPPLVGLAVPEGYALPDGYVRHHQATDDGQPIEAILMFAPDRPVLDAAGRPIAVPADRVVTPALAPPGFPIRTIVIPAPQP